LGGRLIYGGGASHDHQIMRRGRLSKRSAKIAARTAKRTWTSHQEKLRGTAVKMRERGRAIVYVRVKKTCA